MIYVTHDRGSPHNENYLRQKSKGPQTDFQTDVRKYSQYEFSDSEVCFKSFVT